MNPDVLAFAIVGCFGLFLLLMIFVTIKNIVHEYVEFRKRIHEAKKKKA